VNSRLTLNLGLRHEFYTDTREVNGLMADLVNITDPASTIGVPYHTAKMNFAPRFGLAWDPTGSGKTSIRVGIGTYFNQVNQREANASDYRFSATYVLTCSWTGGANPCSNFPYVPANPPLSTSKSEGAVQFNLPTPTVIQYGLDVQRQLTNTMTLRVGYVGWNGYNLTRSSAANAKIVDPATGLFTTAGAVKPNQFFGNITLVSADTVANYNSLQVEFRKSLGAGLTFQTSYTFAKALSEADSSANRVADNVGTGYLSSDPLNPSRDYGRSATDQRHVLVVNSQYDLPFARRLNGGIPKAILGGWAINGIFLYGTGLPLNINDSFNRSGNGDSIAPDRPNLNPGFSNNPTSGFTAGCGGGLIPAGQALRTPNRWFDPCAFSAAAAGTYGNLGRDTVDGPGTVNVNFAVAKNMAFTERVKLQFRAEFFNMLNHPQFKTPGNLIFNAPPSPTAPVPYLATAGSIVSTTGEGLGGRNIQFGLKLTF
jgi:hypothetical protein